MIYEIIDSINYLALVTASETNDENEILSRRYENNVEINYTINEKDKIVHILYIESQNMNKGYGTAALKEFLNDFILYDVEIEAVFFLKKWYEKLGFTYKHAIDEMLCYKMKLERDC